MPLPFLSSGVLDFVPANYYLAAGSILIICLALRIWTSGPSNPRDRDMHGRTVIMTGALSPTGLTVLHALAERGAQVVALVPTLSSPDVQLLLSAIQEQTSNNRVFAEQCDISSPASIQAFCKEFMKRTAGTGLNSSDPPRLDALIFAHEYTHIGVFGAPLTVKTEEARLREQRSMATFMLTNLLLPLLIRFPADRDIRIINLVNPFYAAAIPFFSPVEKPSPVSSTLWVDEGSRSLRSILFFRHVQRVLNALVQSNVPKPQTDESAFIPRAPASNIVAVTVCPGFSRTELIASALGIGHSSRSLASHLRTILYIILYPLLLIFTKSGHTAAQTPLYTLFMPSPLKQHDTGAKTIEGGQLYRNLQSIQLPSNGAALAEDESVGRAIWETFEKDVQKWEDEEKAELAKEQKDPKNGEAEAVPENSKPKGKSKAE